MRTLLRILIALLLVLWLGAVMFFPVVAWVAFTYLPDPHTAGLVVRNCLLALHKEGFAAGSLLFLLLLAAAATRAYGRTVIGPVFCVAAMLALTAFSQGSILPRMEVDRLAVGGDIDRAPSANFHKRDFNRLHRASEQVEEGVLAAGILAVVLLARTPKPKLR